jgi:hypothetical protein
MRIGIIALSTVIFAVLLSGCFGPPLKDCGTDLACFEEAAEICEPAKVRYEMGTAELGVEGAGIVLYMEVRGGTMDECSYYYQLADVKLPAGTPAESQAAVALLIGSDMVCTTSVQIASTGGQPFIDSCEGSLKDLGLWGQTQAYQCTTSCPTGYTQAPYPDCSCVSGGTAGTRYYYNTGDWEDITCGVSGHSQVITHTNNMYSGTAHQTWFVGSYVPLAATLSTYNDNHVFTGTEENMGAYAYMDTEGIMSSMLATELADEGASAYYSTLSGYTYVYKFEISALDDGYHATNIINFGGTPSYAIVRADLDSTTDSIGAKRAFVRYPAELAADDVYDTCGISSLCSNTCAARYNQEPYPDCTCKGPVGLFIGGMSGGGGGASVFSGGTTTSRVLDITGTVSNLASGSTVQVLVNGEEQTADVDGDTYAASVLLSPGENTITVVVVDEDGNIVEQTSETVTVTANIESVDAIVQLTWDTPGNDVDLHLWGPEGNHIYYRDKDAITGGELDIDDTDGYGPETITLGSTAPSGTYTIKVRYYSAHGVSDNVEVRVKLTLAGSPILYGPYTFTASQANQDDPSNDILVDTFTMG